MIENYIPFARPVIGDEEIDEVLSTLKSGWLTTGKKVKVFEEKFSEYIGSQHAIAVNSATAGLHLSLDAIGIHEGDLVLTTPFTFTATAEVIRYQNADPVFVDINPGTLTIDVGKIEEIISKKSNIKAIIPVHYAGMACEMDPIKSIADKYGCKIIEDSAHALPASYNEKMIGTIGDLTVFSFYATKTITTGEGGMIVTDNAEYIDRIKTMRLHGINRDVFDRYTSKKPEWSYEVVAPGYKYNMTDLAASIGIHQLNKANIFQARREWIATQYDQAFQSLPLELPPRTKVGDIHSWHLYVIRLELENLNISRDRFIEKMAESGIGTSVHFIPLHLQPYWKDKYGYKPEDFPVSCDVYSRIVSLPIYPGMSDDDVERVISEVTRILVKYSK